MKDESERDDDDVNGAIRTGMGELFLLQNVTGLRTCLCIFIKRDIAGGSKDYFCFMRHAFLKLIKVQPLYYF